jgi:hypothetical protein
MSNIRNLLEKMDQFAGQSMGQKPGDQVRGTDKATKKKSGQHPFAGRLVGGCEESAGSLLRELQLELNKPVATVRRDLFREFAEFKQGVAEGSLELNTPDPVVVIQDVKGNMLDKLNLSVASQKYKLGNPQDIKNQLAHQNYTTVGSYVIVSPMGGQPQDKTTQGVTEEDAWHSSEDAPQDAWHSSQDAPQDAWHGETSESQGNPADAVSMDIPLLIRIMEYAKEDAKTDMDLHRVAERLIAMGADGNTLGMDQYDAIVGQSGLDEEIVAPATPGVAPAPAANTAANPAAMAQMKAQQLKTLAAQKKSTQDQIKQTQEQLDALRKQLASLSNPANVAMPGVTGTAE